MGIGGGTGEGLGKAEALAIDAAYAAAKKCNESAPFLFAVALGRILGTDYLVRNRNDDHKDIIVSCRGCPEPDRMQFELELKVSREAGSAYLGISAKDLFEATDDNSPFAKAWLEALEIVKELMVMAFLAEFRKALPRLDVLFDYDSGMLDIRDSDGRCVLKRYVSP